LTSSEPPAGTSAAQDSPPAGRNSAAAAAAAAGGSSDLAALPDDSSKLKALFELWDKSGDGRVSLQELCLGLAKFQPVKSKQVSLLM
jgi:hypothetical protein